MAATKQTISRYRQWQQDSRRHITPPSDEQHHCHCCEADYKGNYCPQCGQRAGHKRITWRSIRAGVMDLWGMGNRSLPYTLWQLLLRPGYLIGDYISGRRQVSFPPIKMLAIVALFVYIITSIVSPDTTTDSDPVDTVNNFRMFDYAFGFFSNHYDVAMMFFFSLLIIPTYFIFRFSPLCSHHTLPEGFFIQVFNSTIALLFLLVMTFFSTWISNYIIFILILCAALITYRSYHQLFGYSHWSTLWRVIAVCLSAILTLGVLIVIDYITFLVTNGEYHAVLRNLLFRIIPYLLGAVVVIGASYFISRRTAKAKTPIDIE